MGQKYDEVAAQLNKVFDESDDYLPAEIVSLLNHRYTAGILEFQTEYYNGNKLWNPINLIKDEESYAIAIYLLSHDLGPISNGKHRRWNRLFLISLRRKLRQLRRTKC